MAGFFPIYFKNYICRDLAIEQSTFLLGVGNSIGGFAIAFLAPILGALADNRQQKKYFLFVLMLIGALGSMALGAIPTGSFYLAIGVYALAALGFSGGNIFYDALIMQVSKPDHFDQVSGMGFGLGYLGGGLLFVLNVLMYQFPQWFGIESATTAVQWSFVTVGIWWILFSLPLFLFVPENMSIESKKNQKIKNVFIELKNTLKKISHHRPLLWFLLGYMLYIDGINTVIKMAVDFGLSLGFDASHLIKALILVQFVAFPAALIFGWAGNRFGAIKAVIFGLVVYLFVVSYGYHLKTLDQFYFLAGTIGCVQGGVQALSRSIFATMVPSENSAEYFGFFNMIGKFASIFGPLVVGLTTLVTANARSGILSLSIFFVIGIVFLFLSYQGKKKQMVP